MDNIWHQFFIHGRMGQRQSIRSGPEVKKERVKGLYRDWERWGPYQKTYTKGLFGSKVFNGPASVDGVPILCRCRDIQQYMQSNNTKWVGILSGATKPACWEDNSTIWNPNTDTYEIFYKYEPFYDYSVSKQGKMGIVKGMIGGPQASVMGVPYQALVAAKLAERQLRGGKKKKMTRKNNKKDRTTRKR